MFIGRLDERGASVGELVSYWGIFFVYGEPVVCGLVDVGSEHASGEECRSWKSCGSAMTVTQIDGFVEQLSVE